MKNVNEGWKSMWCTKNKCSEYLLFDREFTKKLNFFDRMFGVDSRMVVFKCRRCKEEYTFPKRDVEIIYGVTR